MDFDALKAFVFAHQGFAGVVGVAAFCIFRAEVVFEVYTAFDDFSAAFAFDGEDVIFFIGFGGGGVEEFFEEVHGGPYVKTSEVFFDA